MMMTNQVVRTRTPARAAALVRRLVARLDLAVTLLREVEAVVARAEALVAVVVTTTFLHLLLPLRAEHPIVTLRRSQS